MLSVGTCCPYPPPLFGSGGAALTFLSGRILTPTHCWCICCVYIFGFWLALC
ncbi:hypothetical protein BDV25DRAFT_152806 [Aspergillus avenaceus]|uniref:Uncharacterized protein n=1 Tax=Aspergillus avenaceus TaxID=36643 RepID=A0A5N6TY91_ASPAV|nr:hypothetical protein BDV25DRAFT_152806 [Aspergillus avenaceus]